MKAKGATPRSASHGANTMRLDHAHGPLMVVLHAVLYSISSEVEHQVCEGGKKARGGSPGGCEALDTCSPP